MFVVFLALSIVSLIILIVGFILLLTVSGKTTRRKGRDVGAEIMSDLGEDDEEGIPVVEKSVFVGTGVTVSREADISFDEIKQAIKNRQWRDGLPALLVIVGLFGLVLFGVFALWLKLDDKLVATLIAAVVIFTVGRIGLSLIRA
jgi:hypothetical protein